MRRRKKNRGGGCRLVSFVVPRQAGSRVVRGCGSVWFGRKNEGQQSVSSLKVGLIACFFFFLWFLRERKSKKIRGKKTEEKEVGNEIRLKIDRVLGKSHFYAEL